MELLEWIETEPQNLFILFMKTFPHKSESIRPRKHHICLYMCYRCMCIYEIPDHNSSWTVRNSDFQLNGSIQVQ